MSQDDIVNINRVVKKSSQENEDICRNVVEAREAIHENQKTAKTAYNKGYDKNIGPCLKERDLLRHNLTNTL